MKLRNDEREALQGYLDRIEAAFEDRDDELRRTLVWQFVGMVQSMVRSAREERKPGRKPVVDAAR